MSEPIPCKDCRARLAVRLAIGRLIDESSLACWASLRRLSAQKNKGQVCVCLQTRGSRRRRGRSRTECGWWWKEKKVSPPPPQQSHPSPGPPPIPGPWALNRFRFTPVCRPTALVLVRTGVLMRSPILSNVIPFRVRLDSTCVTLFARCSPPLSVLDMCCVGGEKAGQIRKCPASTSRRRQPLHLPRHLSAHWPCFLLGAAFFF